MKHPHWARREIDRLDPTRDARRIAHLSFEVRYGAPVFVHPLFAMAFARQVAVPDIADVLYRNGKGIILQQTAKRNDDTLVFFGLLFRHLGTPEGDRIAARIRRIHDRFEISNDLNLYTLASLACLPRRVSVQFAGKELLSPKENAALYQFWVEVAAHLGIRGIPQTPDELLAWMLEYEQSEFQHTPGGRAVTLALAREFAERWFPKPLRPRGERLFFALFDDHLRATHRLDAPTAVETALVKLVVRSFFWWTTIAPDPADRSLVELFGQRYGRSVDPEQVGP